MNPLRLPSAVVSEVPGTGEAVVLDPRSGRILALNALGAAVWELLDGSRGLDELTRVVCAATGAGAEDVATDVGALLERLDAEGFLAGGAWESERNPGPDSPEQRESQA